MHSRLLSLHFNICGPTISKITTQIIVNSYNIIHVDTIFHKIIKSIVITRSFVFVELCFLLKHLKKFMFLKMMIIIIIVIQCFIAQIPGRDLYYHYVIVWLEFSNNFYIYNKYDVKYKI